MGETRFCIDPTQPTDSFADSPLHAVAVCYHQAAVPQITSLWATLARAVVVPCQQLK